MSYNIIRPATHAEWLAQRSRGIGSSEVATILGLNPFDTPYQLWRRKRGIDGPVPENDAMRAGHILEGAVATYFEQETGHTVIKASDGDWLAVDSDRDYMRVSPDRTYWVDEQGKRNEANKGILECKTTQLDVDADDLPAHWFCQLQYQLGVMGYTSGTLAWLTRGRKFGCKAVTFDADLYGYITESVEHFWLDNIVGGREPDMSGVDDVLLRWPLHTAGKTIEATPELMDSITTIKSLKPQIDTLTEQKKEAEELIKAAMRDADSLVLPGSSGTARGDVLATFRAPKPGRKFDEKLFKAEHPDLYEAYCREQQGARRFLVK